MVDVKPTILEDQRAKEASRSRTQHRQNMLFRALSTKITYKALGLLYQQCLQATAELNDRQPHTVCMASFSQQYGLPCKHEMLRLLYNEEGTNPPRIVARRAIGLYQIASFWHLQAEYDGVLRLQDPIIQPRRPAARNVPESIPERIAS
ncbi:hypothetical protein V1525DRAFT_402138 [Lipomyces kononenkoae]|uniref:Uncharacterized protein n=1 Tax=Lipomyces kononenkoae TaxID=34357 RepID=A0ACC3T2L5_LIPKO